MTLKKSHCLFVVVFIAAVVSTVGQSNKDHIKSSLIGKHSFGVQFIWDGYGTAVITEEDHQLKIKGEQYSNSKDEYVKINGILTVLDDRKLQLEGAIELYTSDCCGEIKQTGIFTFLKSGKRKYWRLQERDQLCSPYTCAYYLDIFE